MVSGASIRRRGRNNSAANCSRSSGEAVKIGRNFVIDGNWNSLDRFEDERKLIILAEIWIREIKLLRII